VRRAESKNRRFADTLHQVIAFRRHAQPPLSPALSPEYREEGAANRQKSALHPDDPPDKADAKLS
jgi:hypothetical protein